MTRHKAPPLHSPIVFTYVFVIFFLYIIGHFTTSAHATDVALSWDENTEVGLAGYRVFHRLVGQSYDYNDPAWQGTTPSCTISDLTENTPHFFVVRAYSTSGNESANSDEVAYRGLMMSNASDRSSSEPLGGQSVNGNLYVFTHPDDDVDTVQFYLDDISMNGTAYTVEDIARYDFDGTAGDGSANPFDTASLENGSHTITAQIQFTDGTEQTLTGAFSVNNTVLPTLESLSIAGSQSVNESTSQPYIATATYSDGSSQSVTANASWSENSAYASISNGVLSSSEITEDEIFTITASFMDHGVTKTAQKTVTIIDVPLANMPPERPVFTSPYNGQHECDLTFEMSTQLFVDPDGDSHTQSRWEISTESQFANLVMDITSTDHLTSLTIPHTLLEEDGTYYLRVRFYDRYLAASEWSVAVEFYTAEDLNDTNGNGIREDQEVGSGVDLDDNGIDDVDEPENIKSVRSEDGSSAIGVYKDSYSVLSIDAVELIDPMTLPEAINFPLALPGTLFSYRVSVSPPGAEANITIYYSTPIPKGATFYKYDTINGWSDYSAYTTFNGDGRSLTLQVKDGGYGDCDGVANGIILDPGGLVDDVTSELLGTESVDSKKEWYQTSCFIMTATTGSKETQTVWESTLLQDAIMPLIGINQFLVSAFGYGGVLLVLFLACGLLSGLLTMVGNKPT